MMLRVGDRVVYNGCSWDIYGFETDPDGYFVVVLIDPNYDAQKGEPDPSVCVRDLKGITAQ